MCRHGDGYGAGNRCIIGRIRDWLSSVLKDILEKCLRVSYREY